MRLLFVNSAWPESWGGGEKWTADAAEWFAARGHDVHVVTRPNARLALACVARGLAVVETPFGGDFDPVGMARARGFIRTHRAQLVVVNFNKEAWHFGLAARALRIPVVARHGLAVLRRAPHHRLLLRAVLSKVIVNAEAIREQYRASGLNVRGIDVIPNGVRITNQKAGELRRRFGVPTNAPLVVAAGRLESQKRLERVIAVAAAILPAHPAAQFLIMGDGPQRAELERRIAAAKLEANVRLMGFQDDFAAVIGDADLFLLTSDEEGAPNVLLEAMAAGVSCVSFAVGAVPQIITEQLGDNCIPAGDVDALTARAARLLRDSALRASTAAQMQNRVRERFSLDSSLERFADIFSQLLQHK